MKIKISLLLLSFTVITGLPSAFSSDYSKEGSYVLSAEEFGNEINSSSSYPESQEYRSPILKSDFPWCPVCGGDFVDGICEICGKEAETDGIGNDGPIGENLLVFFIAALFYILIIFIRTHYSNHLKSLSFWSK